MADHNRDGFRVLKQRLVDSSGKLVLDSGCGTGEGTRRLASRHSDCLVLGVDKSAVRLHRSRSLPLPENALLLRAELADFWHLLNQKSIRLQAHYILYPNPWPKSRHLQRRWHGHPAFADLIALGGYLELRSNWSVYVDEFAAALHYANAARQIVCGELEAPDLWTPFERKYFLSGQRLHYCRADLSLQPSTRYGPG